MRRERAPSRLLTGGGLEAELGRPRPRWTAEDLVDLFRDRRFRTASLLHVGGDAWLKRLDFVPSSPEHLREILEAGERADGSSLFPGTGIPPGSSDILLRPRVETAFLDPFAEPATLSVLCGHARPDGSPLPQSPHTILSRAVAALRSAAGLELRALGEVEFFLGRRSEEPQVYGEDDRAYHAAAPVVFGEPLRRRAMVVLADVGVPLKYGHAEVGYIEPGEDGFVWEQHEIELGLADPVAAADGILLTQWVLRTLARREGLRCSTEPVVRRGHAGNGLHVHLAPARDGELLPLRGDDGRLADEARWLIGGLVRLAPALMAFGNRRADSFLRVSQAKEAPSRVTWGEHDRSALIRLPVALQDAGGRTASPPTVEFRLPDGSAFPHLLLAGVALAALEGREIEDLEAVLEAARSRNGAGGGASPVPGDFGAVADALAARREALRRGDAFPADWLEAVEGALRERAAG